MGYANSPKVIQRVKKYLDQLVAMEGKKIEWIIEVSDGSNAQQRFIYYLREAFNYATKHDIPPYNKLKSLYTIKQVGSMKIIAEPKSTDAVVVLSETMSKLELPEIDSLISLIGAVVQNAHADEIWFPNVDLSSDELRTLHKFVKDKNKFMIVGEGVTVLSNDPGDISWSPEKTMESTNQETIQKEVRPETILDYLT